MLNAYQHQRGVGLLEVLIAVLLLAVAVLGFSAMQMQAVKATDETLIRSDAMVAVRNISEDLRLLPTQNQKNNYLNEISTIYSSQLANDTAPTAPAVDCATTTCNPEQQMAYNAFQSLSLAFDSQVKINAMECPGSTSNELQKICLIAAWGSTTPTQGGTNTDCITSSAAYRAGATCFVMETY